jgi:hypothetical protein
LNQEKWGRDQEKNRETYAWVWTANESLQRSRTANWCQIKNCKLKKRQRIKKRESERRRFVKRNKNLTLFTDLKQWSRVFCFSALHDWNCFSLIRFYLCLQLQQLCIVHLRCFGLLTGQNDVVWRLCIYKKRRSGLSRVCPGHPSFGLTHRVDRVSPANFQTGFCLDPDRSQARIGRVPGWPARPVRVSKHWMGHLRTLQLSNHKLGIKNEGSPSKTADASSQHSRNHFQTGLCVWSCWHRGVWKINNYFLKYFCLKIH